MFVYLCCMETMKANIETRKKSRKPAVIQYTEIDRCSVLLIVFEHFGWLALSKRSSKHRDVYLKHVRLAFHRVNSRIYTTSQCVLLLVRRCACALMEK